MDATVLPSRTRLFCALVAGLRYGQPSIADELDDLLTAASRQGFDNLAASCRVIATDRSLNEQRYADVVEQATLYLAAPCAYPRITALLLLNQSLALVRLARADEARRAARAALRALPGAAHWVVATFALATAFEGRLYDAALLHGYAASVRGRRDERPDPAEADAIDETLHALQTRLASDRLAVLLAEGAALHEDEALRLALAD